MNWLFVKIMLWLKENVTPVHKKDNPTNKTNFWPVSVLPSLWKEFERAIYNQLGKYMGTFVQKLLCRFRRAHALTMAEGT